MQRKTEKDQALDSFQFRRQFGTMFRRGLRSHAPSHGLASREHWEIRRGFAGHTHCRSNDGLEHGWRVWDAAPLLHVRELISERGHLGASQFMGKLTQKRMIHSGAGAMRQYQRPARIGRPQP
jgi:hypothetical protein